MAKASTHPDLTLNPQLVPMIKIRAAEANPKRHNLDGITASIVRHGFVEPVIMDRRTDRLLGGHGRLEALRRMWATGHSPPNGVVAADDESSNPTWLIPVVWTESADDGDARALLIALNRLPEAGGWDRDELATLLDELRTDSTLDGTGYDDADVDKLLKGLAATDAADPADDTGPQLGDTLFRLAVDCTDETQQAELAAELESRGFTVQLQMT